MRIIFAVLCFLIATILGAIAEARTTRIKTKTEVVHRHVHEHVVTAVAPSVTVYSSPAPATVLRPLTGGERRRLQRNGAIVIVP